MTTTREAALEAALQFYAGTEVAGIKFAPGDDAGIRARAALSTPATEPQWYVAGMVGLIERVLGDGPETYADWCRDARALLAARPDPQPAADRQEADVAIKAWQDLCEMGDRTSQEEYPDMALITFDELAAAIQLGREKPAADTRVVTVEMLERWASEVDAATYWDHTSDDVRQGSDPTAHEIRAIIGNTTPADAVAALAARDARMREAGRKVKPLIFAWVPDKHQNPSCMRLQSDDFSAYVLIPFDPSFDPAAGVGQWNGVANHKGQTGFASRADAQAYCEETIRNDAHSAIEAAMRWLDPLPPPPDRPAPGEGGRVMADLPQFALSIRQPWAWAIINAGKDVENRDWPTKFRGPVCIHAAKGMTRSEFDGFVDLARAMSRAGTWPASAWVPFTEELQRGGIIGVAEIRDCVEESPSPWFFGRYGFVLRNVHPVDFIPVRGSLGFFDWRAALVGVGQPQVIPTNRGKTTSEGEGGCP